MKRDAHYSFLELATKKNHFFGLSYFIKALSDVKYDLYFQPIFDWCQYFLVSLTLSQVSERESRFYC